MGGWAAAAPGGVGAPRGGGLGVGCSSCGPGLCFGWVGGGWWGVWCLWGVVVGNWGWGGASHLNTNVRINGDSASVSNTIDLDSLRMEPSAMTAVGCYLSRTDLFATPQ